MRISLIVTICLFCGICRANDWYHGMIDGVLQLVDGELVSGFWGNSTLTATVSIEYSVEPEFSFDVLYCAEQVWTDSNSIEVALDQHCFLILPDTEDCKVRSKTFGPVPSVLVPPIPNWPESSTYNVEIRLLAFPDDPSGGYEPVLDYWLISFSSNFA